MDAKLKAKWVKALRSGKYRQGTGRLKREREDGEDEYCCLGVLREIQPNIPSVFDDKLLDASVCGIPRETQQVFAEMNDDRASFEEIAYRIEKEL